VYRPHDTLASRCPPPQPASEAPKPGAGPVLSIEPASLVIALPTEGDYQEGSVQLTKDGSADVLITEL